MKSQIKRKHFTLIEMIAVVAIAGMLVALFAPAFNRMMFGSKVDQAASGFKLGLEMAQTKAVAERKYVAMVIPCHYADAGAKFKQYVLGGYRLAYVKKVGDKYYFNNWIPGISWRNADDGARLVRMEAVQSEDNPWLRLYQKKHSENNDSLEDKDLLPKLIEDDNYDSGMMVEMEYESSSSNKDEDLESLTEKNWTAVVFSPYGGITNDTRPLLFFFTETKNNSGTFECPNPDNTAVLMLNSITGRVEYITEDSNEEENSN